MTDQEHETITESEKIQSEVGDSTVIHIAMKRWDEIKASGRKVYYDNREISKITSGQDSLKYVIYYAKGLGNVVFGSSKVQIK